MRKRDWLDTTFPHLGLLLATCPHTWQVKFLICSNWVYQKSLHGECWAPDSSSRKEKISLGTELWVGQNGKIWLPDNSCSEISRDTLARKDYFIGGFIGNKAEDRLSWYFGWT